MLAQLLEVLSPRPLGQDRFSAGNMHPAAFRVYGGQVLAQCVSAAVATVEAERAPELPKPPPERTWSAARRAVSCTATTSCTAR